MAKRRKVVDNEEVFKEPEFDEVQFLKDEIVKAKGIILLFVLAIAVGFASAYLQVFGGDFLAYGLGVLVLISMKWILGALHIQFKDRKTWVFAILAFLLIWIATWTVGLNPPFNDVSPPQIRTVEVYNGTSWVLVYDYRESFNPQLAKEIKKNVNALPWNNITAIRAYVTDNMAVGKVTINGATAKLKGDYYEVKVEPPIADVIITAWDNSGHMTKLTISK